MIIHKFGPFFGATRITVKGRPVSVDHQHYEPYVWCEVDPNKDEEHTLYFVATGMEYTGKYIGTVHIKASDDTPYVFHCIEDV